MPILKRSGFVDAYASQFYSAPALCIRSAGSSRAGQRVAFSGILSGGQPFGQWYSQKSPRRIATIKRSFGGRRSNNTGIRDMGHMVGCHSPGGTGRDRVQHFIHVRRIHIRTRQ